MIKMEFAWLSFFCFIFSFITGCREKHGGGNRATAYFYLGKPSDELPALQNATIRTCNLRTIPLVKTK